MKRFFLTLSVIMVSVICAFGQAGRDVTGLVMDTTKTTIPGATVILTSDLKADSTAMAADINGKFAFHNIKGTKVSISVASIGYQPIRKHFTLANDGQNASVGVIVLHAEANMLNQVNIHDVNAITFKEDTTEYKASAYPVRANAPVEDVIKKLPGVDVDINGNITTQGKQVTKVRINGKDFMGGDVQSITKNLPADVVENIQMIDDYGDQANLTGVKTGDPDKIMNITIRKDKNYGYSLQATGGDGEDDLPKDQGIADQNRYLGTLSSFIFNGNQQIAVLGTLNNTNVNTFSYGTTTGGGGLAGGGFGGAGFGGGGGRSNASRAQASSGSLITSANGITNAHALGANFRDQWGKNLVVYGSYSFSDNDVYTKSTTTQQNYGSTTNDQQSSEHDANINDRFTWNMEWTPDTSNYLKITPTFSYASTVTNETETDSILSKPTLVSLVNQINYATSSSPTFGLNILYNHKFRKRHNFSAYITASSTTSNSYSNPLSDYLVGQPLSAADQMISTYSRTNSIGTTLSYLTPLSHTSFLEFNYAFNYSATNNDKVTDTSTSVPPIAYFSSDSTLTNRYNFNFMTNRFGLNYRVVQKKYNYILGVAVQPSELNGVSLTTGGQTHVNTFDFIPTARFVYNFSRSHTFQFYYNGSNAAPSFSQLQPVIDKSNPLYPVEGNPYLNPQFTNNLMVRYNSFDFNSGNALFTNISYQQISNYITTNQVTYKTPSADGQFAAHSILTQYLNVPGDGYESLSSGFVYSKPWDTRKYTLSLTGQVAYTNTIDYLTQVNGTDSVAQRNSSKNLQFTPGLKFRVDIQDHVDVQLWTQYAINHTSNTVPDSLESDNTRTWSIFFNGKNYFGDWTFSYDYEKYLYYGYAKSLSVTNPNILNVYLERRFLKNNAATIRLAVFDLFNQNTGFSTTSTPTSFTESHVNRLARYYLATLTIRLQKFAGKAPTDERQMRRNGGGGYPGPGGGGRGPGGGPGAF
jgi:hypothetical protein